MNGRGISSHPTVDRAMEWAENPIPHQRDDLALGPTFMNVDALHTALGLAFTAIWLLVGQILVGDRK